MRRAGRRRGSAITTSTTRAAESQFHQVSGPTEQTFRHRLRQQQIPRFARDDSQRGNAKATYVPPLGAPFLPPPQAMTTYCRPFTMYVDGVALPAAGSWALQSSRPVRLSKA